MINNQINKLNNRILNKLFIIINSTELTILN